MNRSFYKRLRVLGNLLLSLSLAVLTFVVLDFFNPKLGFLSSGYSVVVIAVLGVTAAVCAGHIIALVRRYEKKKELASARKGVQKDGYNEEA